MMTQRHKGWIRPETIQAVFLLRELHPSLRPGFLADRSGFVPLCIESVYRGDWPDSQRFNDHFCQRVTTHNRRQLRAVLETLIQDRQ